MRNSLGRSVYVYKRVYSLESSVSRVSCMDVLTQHVCVSCNSDSWFNTSMNVLNILQMYYTSMNVF